MLSIFRTGSAAVLASAFCLFASGQAFAADPIFACAAKDTGVMRIVKAAKDCKATETSMKFAEWQAEKPEPPKDDAAEKQIAALEKKIAALETQLDKKIEQKVSAEVKEATKPEPASATTKVNAPQRVTAPFEVVSKGGKVLLRVAERVSVQNDDAGVTIGYGSTGNNMAVRVHNNSGAFVAGLGQAAGGPTGVVAAANGEGKTTVMLSGRDHGLSVFDADASGESAGIFGKRSNSDVPLVVLYGKKSEAVAFLTYGTNGGGNLTLANDDGFGVFSAGSAGDGGGEACLNRVTGGGKQRNVCLGVELPSMGLGK